MKKQGLEGKHPMLILLPWLFLIFKKSNLAKYILEERIKSKVQVKTKLRYYESKIELVWAR